VVIDTLIDNTSTSDDDHLPEVSDSEYNDHYSSIPEEDWYPRRPPQSDVPEFSSRIVDISVLAYLN